MDLCSEITKNLVIGKTFFWGFYMTDGINLTNAEWEQYTLEIPTFFKTYGKYEEVYKTSTRDSRKNTPLSIACCPIDEYTYKMCPKLFHYYLETNFFCPNITWETFVKSFSNYLEHGCRDYVQKKFTDFLFSYVDSGDFIISFNPQAFIKEEIIKIILRTIQ